MRTSCLYGLLAAVAAVGTRAALPLLAQSAAPQPSPILQRFLAFENIPLTGYRALRHLDASNEKFNSTAWMDVWTEADARGFRYQIAAEGGSDYIRSRVFRGTLETEQKSWAAHAPARAALTEANYSFEDRGVQPDGLLLVAVKPYRKDVLLVDGFAYVRPDGDLARLEGRLSKSPSFWTRHVTIVRHYERIAGVRVPVALETASNVLIAGQSTFTMRWEYESINEQRVGDPQPRDLASPP